MKNSYEEKVKTMRLIEIDSRIRDNEYPNVPKLMKSFECSRSTIMRDLEFLRDRYGAPLEYDKARKGFHYTTSSFFIKSVLLSEGELFSISVIQPLLEQYTNTPLEKSIKGIFLKLIGLLSTDVSVNTDLLNTTNVSFIADPIPKLNQEVFTKVFESLRNKKVLSFEYGAQTNVPEPLRTADPLHVICHHGDWYMLAFCHKRNEIRTFSLARIQNPEVTDTTFTVPANFNPQKYFDSSFGIWNTAENPVNIELLFDKKFNSYISEHSWHNTQKITENADGSVVLSFSSNQLVQVCNWVLSFGEAVKVLNPPELVQAVKDKIVQMGKIYN